MDKIEIKNKLKNILENYVEIDENNFNESTNLTNDMGIDSFSLICMVGEIENEFKINMNTTVLSNIHTFGEMIDYVANI